MNGVAATVSGTIAASVPIEVPAIRRVNGMIATTRMMNGVERVALTTHAEHAIGQGAANSSPFPAGRQEHAERQAEQRAEPGRDADHRRVSPVAGRSGG